MPITLATAVGPSWPVAIGPNYNTFTARQDVSPRGAGIGELPTIQGGSPFFGMKIKIEADGEYSSTGTPTLVLGFYIGTAAGVPTTALAESSAMATSTAGNYPWRMKMRGVFVGTGTAGSIVVGGELKFGTALTTFSVVPIPITLALRTVAWDTTIARSVGVCATWSASSASNNVRTYNHEVVVVNGP